MRAICPVYLIFNFIIPIISEEHKLSFDFFTQFSSNLLSLQSPSASAPCSETPSVCSIPLVQETQLHIRTQQQAKLEEITIGSDLIFTILDVR
jgi:hypothetical protein